MYDLPTRRTAMMNDERGATALEYGLTITLIAGVVAVALGPFGDAVAALLTDALAWL